jgi:hypothetical protein
MTSDGGTRRSTACRLAVAVLWVGLVGPFHGVWRLLASPEAGAFAYLVVFLVIMIVIVVKTLVHGRRMRRDPKGYFEKITGNPWPPGRPES